MWCSVAHIFPRSPDHIFLWGASMSGIRGLNFSLEMCEKSTRSFQFFGKGAQDGTRTGPASSGGAGARCVMS